LQCGVYEGQMFREANEAVIGRLLAEKLDVKIGDEIEIECAGNRARFIVTGYQQSVINMGERVFISAEGLKRLGLQPEFSGVRIRVEDATEEAVDDVLSQAKEVLGESCTGVDNVYRYQRSGDNLIMFAATLLILLLIFVNIGIIFLVIKLLLKTVFIRKEKEFGIKKAVGFTSRQLRLQLALSLFPVSFIASIGGAILGFLLVNPLLSAVLSGFGIASADFLLVPALIFITIAVVGILVFGMTYLMSGRMKKISAYQLMQE
ncbi:MAG: ABC transporter permease, partial [Eubacterium sp.]|nr:ABC transporter permease [Eubacterium sp.]